MRPPVGTLAFPGLVAVLLLGSPAHADRQEKRLSVAGGGAVLAVERAGATGDLLAPAGHLRLAWGLTNWLDMGASVGAAGFTTAELTNATVEGHRGTLYFDIYQGEISLDARAIAGVGVLPLFERLHPFAGVRAGVATALRRNEQLLDDAGLRIAGTDNSFDAAILLGVEAGLEYRFGRGFLVGLEGRSCWTAELSTASANIALTWAWY